MAFSDYAHLCIANNGKSILNSKYTLKDTAVELYKGFVYLHNQTLWNGLEEKDFNAPVFKQLVGDDSYVQGNLYVVTRKAPNGGVYVYAQQEWGDDENVKSRCFAGIATLGYKDMFPEALKRIESAYPELNITQNFAQHEQDFSVSTVFEGERQYFSIILPETLYPNLKDNIIEIDDADLFHNEWVGIDSETMKGFDAFLHQQTLYRNEAWYEAIDFSALSYINPGDRILEEALDVEPQSAVVGQTALSPLIQKMKF